MKRAALVVVAIAAGAVAAPGPARIEPVHFSHEAHAKRNVDTGQCATCHSVDPAGRVMPPAAVGHSPCLSAGCHATAFVSTGAATRAKDPAAYAKATAFCLGCHDSADGTPPSPATHQVASAALRSYQGEREYHVELSHFDHTKRTECRTCHVVDPATFALARSAPGHAECVTCHNPQKYPSFTMAKCDYCHHTPGRVEYFHGSRKQTDVRACDSEGYAALVAKAKDGKPVACFRHERSEHRFAADGKPVQCGACHGVVTTSAMQSVGELHTRPIIDNTEAEHNRCGNSAACHARDFANAAGAKRCLVCHGDHTRSLFE
jgi:hypothetical protein